LTRSAAEWRRIGLDDEDEFMEVVYFHVKKEGTEKNEMVERDAFVDDNDK